MKQNNNALQILGQLMKQTNWHQNFKTPKAAAQDKTNLKKGKLSYENACKWLQKLGWQKIKEEVWQKL